MAAVATSFYEGKAVKIGIIFTDELGVETDPTTIVLKYKLVDGAGKLVGSLTTHTFGQAGSEALLRTSAGRYYEVFSTTGHADQRLKFDWEGMGAIQAAAGSSFWISTREA